MIAQKRKIGTITTKFSIKKKKKVKKKKAIKPLLQ